MVFDPSVGLIFYKLKPEASGWTTVCWPNLNDEGKVRTGEAPAVTSDISATDTLFGEASEVCAVIPELSPLPLGTLAGDAAFSSGFGQAITSGLAA